MPKTISGFFQFISNKIINFPQKLAKQSASLVFKSLLIPTYKIFLFIEKKFIHNPNLSYIPKASSSKPKPIVHIIIIIITIFVLINNFSTKNTYAGELNQNSIIAKLFTDKFEELIIEESPPLETITNQPKTESILSQLSAITAQKKSNPEKQSKKSEENGDNIALAQGGEALIKPTLPPFSEEKQTIKNETSASTSKNIRYYTIKSGDTLSTIAKKFGINVNTILWENNLSLSSYIRPGEKLTILPTDGITHTVKSGDTLSAIANRFGTSVDKIISANNLSPNSILKVRQKLIIPDGKLGITNITPTHSVGSLARAFKASTDKPSVKNFLWPSATSKRITQYYHWGHHAIDIGARKGTPIIASRSGRIIRAGWSRGGYGYNIVIDHGNGIQTLYAHASKLYVKRGDQVVQGQTIGAVGSTGNSTGPHIHFEIRINGTKVNPLSYL